MEPTAVSTFQHDAPAPISDFRSNGQRRQSELDWIIPVEPKREPRARTFQERIDPSLKHAKSEREKCELKARLTGYALNANRHWLAGHPRCLNNGLIGSNFRTADIYRNLHSWYVFQNHLGNLDSTEKKGGFATLVASYLARARGSNEPELSITRVKDLDQYIRECEIFILDYGHLTGNEHDSKLNALRDRFEELLGNANG
ncbi:Carbamoyl-phosphate synth [Mycena venus]|uniref:Carbamoyl-phosphate synth n=1 Tax=Mycena venus TaxID=2733690 RepID=A0A8H7C961_9AGAR|nr:Carbamoyl-phosphate synth [Mycena venus]